MKKLLMLAVAIAVIGPAAVVMAAKRPDVGSAIPDVAILVDGGIAVDGDIAAFVAAGMPTFFSSAVSIQTTETLDDEWNPFDQVITDGEGSRARTAPFPL